MTTFIAAAIQMTSGDEVEANIAAVSSMIHTVVKDGASFVTLPENAFYLRREGTVKHPDVPMEEHRGVLAMQTLAQTHGIWILIGSIRARQFGMDKPFNRSVLIADDGHIVATYDKIHLFDVTLPTGQRYEESSQARAGTGLVAARLPHAVLGMSVCYDVRFPQLYRALSLAGAELLAVPSAFTRPTGEAHWRTLLTARAIENGAYVIAPAQCGTHPGGRETYGHSMILGPWGEVLAHADGVTPGVILAEINRARVAEVRAQLPVLEHHRELAAVEIRE